MKQQGHIFIQQTDPFLRHDPVHVPSPRPAKELFKTGTPPPAPMPPAPGRRLQRSDHFRQRVSQLLKPGQLPHRVQQRPHVIQPVNAPHPRLYAPSPAQAVIPHRFLPRPGQNLHRGGLNPSHRVPPPLPPNAPAKTCTAAGLTPTADCSRSVSCPLGPSTLLRCRSDARERRKRPSAARVNPWSNPPFSTSSSPSPSMAASNSGANR